MPLLEKEIFKDYEMLMPSRFDGGYLIASLYYQIGNGDISELFAVTDIRRCLQEIADAFGQATPQTDRILKLLSYHFLRSDPDQPGKYYLSDYAKNVVELMSNKLESPYKNFPLKLSFDKAFTLKLAEIRTISDLESRFGRIFIEGPKKVINDHLQGLEDELRKAYLELNSILEFRERDAVSLVRRFAQVFQQFGMRADDITNAMTARDKFIKDLEATVDEFYNRINASDAETPAAASLLEQRKSDWEKARDIYRDIRTFFKAVDQNINYIRRQIFDASEKLSELHEHFTERAQMRIQVKRLYAAALEQACYHEDGASFQPGFPLKMLAGEKPRMIYPEQYDFLPPPPNQVIRIPRDEAYERQERQRIDRENRRSELILEWVDKIKERLRSERTLQLQEVMDQIAQREGDIGMAYQVAAVLVDFTAGDAEHRVDIAYELVSIKNNEIRLWKTNLRSLDPTNS